MGRQKPYSGVTGSAIPVPKYCDTSHAPPVYVDDTNTYWELNGCVRMGQ